MPEAALISIHPRYVDAILSGEKRVEFRKVPFRRPVDRLIVYATAPVSAIVAIIEVGDMVHDTPSNLWELYADIGAIHEDDFWAYYQGRSLALAVEIADVRRLPRAVELVDVLPEARPPQSFRYVSYEAIRPLLG
ncbi:MAG: ASCH domain-containing protein [Fimbriimonadaceae bacterium]|nr:ASCH domain-containing protein [Fimbriimonadaceae bacterium]QYK57864.1 MAG: ASCH domain-containing protein [Fimbriimonadaceae bacterium]